MSKQEILALLIPHYEGVIKELSVDGTTIKLANEILEQTKTHHGICYCANHMFNTWIYEETWVKQHVKHVGNYWSEPPYGHYSINEKVKALSERLRIMKTEQQTTE